MSARSYLRSTRPLGVESLEERRLLAGRVDFSGPVSQVVNIPAAMGAIDTSVASPTKIELARQQTIATQNAKAVNFTVNRNYSNFLALEIRGTNANDSLNVTQLRTGEIQFKLDSVREGKLILSQTYTTKEHLDYILFDAFAGDDTFTNGTAIDTGVAGGEGNDRLTGGDGYDILLGGEGKDILLGGGDSDFLCGDDGDDLLDGGSGSDSLYGDGGNDCLVGGTGEDILCGGDNDDTLLGGTGADLLNGNSGSDFLSGDEDADQLKGGEGDDRLLGGSGNDQIWGDDGNDWIWGDAGEDRLYGNSGDDLIYGGTGLDWLYGDNGNDYLDGGADTTRDYLFGGLGRDTYRGDWISYLDSSRRLVKRTNEICIDIDEILPNQSW